LLQNGMCFDSARLNDSPQYEQRCCVLVIEESDFDFFGVTLAEDFSLELAPESLIESPLSLSLEWSYLMASKLLTWNQKLN
jgi:hypothetical protein